MENTAGQKLCILEWSFPLSSVDQLCPALCNSMDCSLPCLLVHHQHLLKLISIESVMTSNDFILCHPLVLLPSIFPSIRVFSNEPVLCISWPKYWSFSFSISLSMNTQDWFSLELTDLIFLQSREQESSPTPQFKSISSSGFSFLYVQISHPYMTTGKTIALIRWTFVGKVISAC